MKIKAHFTKNKDPYDGVIFEERISQLQKVGEETTPVKMMAPKSWSQVAVDILANKYRRKSGVPSKDQGEDDLRDIISRMVNCWSRWGLKENYFASKKEAKIFSDEITYMLVHQMAAPNSPQWFNTGLYDSYGIKGSPQGHYFFDSKTQKVKKSKSSYERPQPHACFIQGVSDSLVGEGGIMDLWEREARLFKFGSGTGTNFSSLRGTGEPLSSGGTSSGLMGWLKIGDAAAGAIKSGGTTRRAAKMVCLDIDHPDVEEFITWKAREEEKLASLVTGHHLIKELKKKASENALTQKDIDQAVKAGVPSGYIEHLQGVQAHRGSFLTSENIDTDWTGIGYQSLTGQNANNSVRVNDSFMKALKSDDDWELINRKSKNRVAKKIPAKVLWKKICESAWLCADPGIQYHSTINSWHTCPAGGEIKASNPCSEYMFLDDTACNLASLNLVTFYKKGIFQIDDFIHACTLWTMVLEISVAMAHYPSEQIAKNSFDYRTLGLGFANLGALLMRLGIPYDSKKARELAGSLSSLMGATAYMASAQMAKAYGPFQKFKENKKSVLNVLEKHHQESLKLKKNEISTLSQETWKKTIQLVKRTGLRNAQVTAIAPTGTIGLVMDCDTTGIEPDYSLVKAKNLAGGGSFSLINRSVPDALKKLGYSERESDEIQKFILTHNEVGGAPFLKEKDYPVFDCAVGSKPERIVSIDGHLKMMAAVQPFISGAISKTINLPNVATVEDISYVFKEAYRLKIKAVAVYRDGCKLSQPLSGHTSPYSQDQCPNCGHQMLVPSGTCYKCENCGESTSCT